MLDIKFIRENRELIKEGARKKRIDFSVDDLIAVDEKRRALLAEVEDMKARQNKTSKEIEQLGDEGKRAQLIAKMKELKGAMQTKEEDLKRVLQEWRALMIQVPNIPDMSVPEGKDDADNKEIKTWGTKPSFSFTPKNHIEIMEALDMADLERGAKVAGFRGYFLKNDGALLSFAIWQAAMEHFLGKGFTPMMVPS